MADNTLQTASANMATDDIGGVHYQRVKATFGVDGTATDVSPVNPFPVMMPDALATGTITATDSVVAAPGGTGAFVTGASTAGSIVSIACPGGDSAWVIQITGLTTGNVYFEASLDSTNGTDGNWIAVNGRQTGVVNTVLANNATTSGLYRGNTSGIKYLRARQVGTLTGTPAIRIGISDGVGAIFLNASIPAGTNNIGTVNVTDGTSGARVTTARELLITDTNRIKVATALLHSGRLTVGAAADTATAGRLWLINPIGSTILIELRRVEFSSSSTAATAFVSSPRVTVERVTFTGTASGATITPALKDSTEAALVGSARTASTGLTLTAGATAYGFTVASVMTAVGAFVPALQEWEPAENGRLVLRAGQGVVIRQADAGTTSDTRSFGINLAWSEFTVLV